MAVCGLCLVPTVNQSCVSTDGFVPMFTFVYVMFVRFVCDLFLLTVAAVVYFVFLFSLERWFTKSDVASWRVYLS